MKALVIAEHADVARELAGGARELGADESSLDAIADATLTMTGGYRTLTRAEVLDVLRKSLAA